MKANTPTKREHKFAVIKWQANNIYRISESVATYIIERAAERKADKLNAEQPSIIGGYVVREIEYML